MYEPPEEPSGDRPRRPRGSGATHAAQARSGPEQRPYTTYRSAPRGLIARLRGENDTELGARAQDTSRREHAAGGNGGGGRDGRGGGGGGRDGGRPQRAPRRGLLRRRSGLPRRPPLHPIRILKYIVCFLVFWVVLSGVLFFISASRDAGNLPGGNATKAALNGAGPILFSANNILIVGLDNRPTSGYSSKEGGLTAADTSETDARTDSIMIWRLGGGVSRRLSIPRDTWVNLPACGYAAKINAAWSCGGPQETIKVVENLTGIKINHLIVVDLGNFTKFINDIGGVTVKTPKICSNISGGAADGGFTLNLSAGVHHLNGDQALTLARTRENSCDLAYDDLQREAMQQQILNSIKSQLFSVHAFTHLPWAAWDAPGVIQTDMGPLSLMQMFIASEIGGSAPSELLTEASVDEDGQSALLPNTANVRDKVNQLMTGK